MKCAAFTLLGALLFSAALASSSHAERGGCVSWAGELDPLPNVSDADPLRAAWAELRADQLAELAASLEPRSRALARRVWRHASCLDPQRPDFADGVARSAPVRWVRPDILGAEEIELRGGDEIPQPEKRWPWDLRAPIRVIVPRISMSERGPSSSGATQEIAAAQSALRQARFELALEWVKRGTELLAAQAETQRPSDQLAQLEVLAATAQIALGRETAARESLERALRAEPEMVLDPALHSPKLVRLLDAIRGEAGVQP